MLPPEYLEGLPDEILKLYAAAEQAILADMARRIGTYDYWIPAADWQNQKLLEAGRLQSDILKVLSRATGKSVPELKKLMEQASTDGLRVDRAIYEEAGQSVPPFSDSEALRAVLNAGYKATAKTMENLTRTTARTATKQFERVLDKAWMKVQSGAFSTDIAVRDAVKELAAGGVKSIHYPSGHEDTLEVAVRRAVVTGVNQTHGKLQLALAEELDCDLMELTAHAGARTGEGAANHAGWQGKIVSLSGREGYLTLEDIGYGTGEGFQGWNCRHGWNPYFEGMPRTWTDEELQKLNEPKYTYNGKRLTEYEAQQQQRYFERQIRRWKRENAAMQAAGLDPSESAVKLRQWQDRQKDFLKQTGLKRQTAREQIAGFGRSEARKATAAAKRAEALVNQQKEAYTKKQEEIRAMILSDGVNKKLNIGNQNKHIKSSGGYIEGRSYIYGDLEDAQDLVRRYHGTGEIKLLDNLEWTNKEFVMADRPIGVIVDPKVGTEMETSRFSIHYGKKGTHIVPAKEKK